MELLSRELNLRETTPTTLDALGNGRAVYIPGGHDVTLARLTITGGDASQGGGGPYGGGIHNAGSVTITNSIVISNADGGYGGGAHNVGSMIVRETTFEDNVSQMGGAIYSDAALTTVSRDATSARPLSMTSLDTITRA